MVIMKSCCFFKNVWSGSCASGVYTTIYFAFSSLILLFYVVDEWDYLMGKNPKPNGETIIEKGDITETHVIFNIVVLTCSVGLVVSSIIMLHGLRKDKRELLLPWILLMIGDVFVEFFYAIYFVFSKRANFDPIVGFIFTVDLFIVCLNTYCLLCVVSQYQAYKEIMNHTSLQTNANAAFDVRDNDYCGTVTVTDLSVSVGVCQSQRSTTRGSKTSQQSKLVSTILEENVSETHL